jgi:hypothetical protein
MNFESGQKPTVMPSQISINQVQHGFDFDSWALQVRRQMIASLKRKPVIYGNFWGNEARIASAKAAATETEPEI